MVNSSDSNIADAEEHLPAAEARPLHFIPEEEKKEEAPDLPDCPERIKGMSVAELQAMVVSLSNRYALLATHSEAVYQEDVNAGRRAMASAENPFNALQEAQDALDLQIVAQAREEELAESAAQAKARVAELRQGRGPPQGIHGSPLAHAAAHGGDGGPFLANEDDNDNEMDD